MAKESMKAREVKRMKLATQHAEKRDALRKAANEGDWDAMMALQKLPKNSMKIRVHNRCMLTGRPRGYMRQFGISRVTFREMALAGKIPGVTKASW
ncbi:MAG: 30S ribosomal protein S14 [Crocinitomicaceae bacterium]